MMPLRSTSMVPRLAISLWRRARDLRLVGLSLGRSRASAASSCVLSRKGESWATSTTWSRSYSAGLPQM